MGTVTAHRGRLTLALIFTVGVVITLLAVAALMTTERASAYPQFTNCATCHTMDSIHGNPAHASIYPSNCSACHTNGTASSPPTSACAACHGGLSAILASPTHAKQTCSTCHSSTPTPTPTPTPTFVTTKATLKVSPTSIKLHKTVKITGTVTTATAAKIALLVEMKKGTKWVKAKSASAAVKSGKYGWTYKPAKKGTYRASGSVVKTTTYSAAKTKAISFKVK